MGVVRSRQLLLLRLHQMCDILLTLLGNAVILVLPAARRWCTPASCAPTRQMASMNVCCPGAVAATGHQVAARQHVVEREAAKRCI